MTRLALSYNFLLNGATPNVHIFVFIARIENMVNSNILTT